LDVLASIAQMVYTFSWPVFIVFAIVLFRTKRKVLKRTALFITLIEILLIVCIPIIGNSEYIKKVEIQWDINHFTKPFPGSEYDSRVGDFASEMQIIKSPKPITVKIIQYDNSNMPDSFYAKLRINNREYSVLFTDPIPPFEWSPFRNFRIGTVQPADFIRW